MSKENELELVADVDAVTVYQQENGADMIIRRVTEAVEGIVFDVTTDKGRKECASIANKVARSKVYLDNLGKELVEEWKTKAKVVDADRKKIRDTLDELKAKVREPLTQWEKAEEKRKEALRSRLQRLVDLAKDAHNDGTNLNAEELRERLFELEAEEVSAKVNGDSLESANRLKNDGILFLKKRIAEREQFEKQQEELAELRRKDAERERQQREERIAREAAERAKAEAEANERKRQEAKEREAREEALRIQREADDRVRAAEEETRKAQAEADAKVQALKDQEDRKAMEKAMREADETHRESILSAAKQGLMLFGCDEKLAADILEGIEGGMVPNVNIEF